MVKKSDLLPLKSGVPQGSVLGPFLFLVYINDFTDNISSNIKFFADDSSLFTRASSITIAHAKLIRDLETIKNWAFQWKCNSILIYLSKLSRSFSRKNIRNLIIPHLTFNNIPVKREDYIKHLGVFLDSHLNIRKHVEEKAKIANKGIGLLRFLSRFVGRKVLDQIYKMFVRPHLAYGDIIYHDQDYMDSMDI